MNFYVSYHVLCYEQFEEAEKRRAEGKDKDGMDPINFIFRISYRLRKREKRLRHTLVMLCLY